MSTTEIVTNTLDKLASEINKEAKLAEQHAMQAVNHALNAGRLLTEAKQQCPHGQWLPWMAKNFEGSARTAQGYMRLFEHKDLLANTQRVAHLSVREALKMLAEPQAVAPEEKPEPYKPPSRDAIERWPDLLDGPSRVFHAEGMSHAQIAELFGVDEDLVKKRMNPEAPHRECGDWADAGLATLYTKRVQNYIYHHQANAYLCAAAFAHNINPKLADGFLALEKHYQEKSRNGVQSIYAVLSDAGELQKIEAVLTQNNFRSIQEDYKKIYDHVSTAIAVKNGANSGRKSDAAFIMTKDKKRWEEVTNVFKQIISANMATADFK